MYWQLLAIIANSMRDLYSFLRVIHTGISCWQPIGGGLVHTYTLCIHVLHMYTFNFYLSYNKILVLLSRFQIAMKR